MCSSLTEKMMRTIIEYSGTKEPENQYPEWIISPPRSGLCCFREMEEIGVPQEDRNCVFRYKRCRTCGFSVREIIRCLPDPALADELREILQKAFQRPGTPAVGYW